MGPEVTWSSTPLLHWGQWSYAINQQAHDLCLFDINRILIDSPQSPLLLVVLWSLMVNYKFLQQPGLCLQAFSSSMSLATNINIKIKRQYFLSTYIFPSTITSILHIASVCMHVCIIADVATSMHCNLHVLFIFKNGFCNLN